MTTKAVPPPSANVPAEDSEGNARRFEHTITRVLSVSKDELAKREAAYQKARRTKKTRSTK